MDTITDGCHLFLRGDETPLPVLLPMETIAARLYSVESEVERGGFVRLPCRCCGKDVLIRPNAVAAIIPDCDCDD